MPLDGGVVAGEVEVGGAVVVPGSVVAGVVASGDVVAGAAGAGSGAGTGVVVSLVVVVVVVSLVRSLQPLKVAAASTAANSNDEDNGFMVIPLREEDREGIQACASVRSSAGISAGISRAR